ncbi:MAG: prepilin-type N-terminal cleavage/methylation domain-containing protein [Phycisphaerales bacterium]|jgi:prepilin-type N-terminal cleavage/methylation domain-containing protein|nr:prepilin-type N-terminal cleavage/methylation domain-containing protein [Phycisphaerales bacterium]
MMNSMNYENRGKRFGSRGFTLIEILIVVVILGILAAIIIPQFASAQSAARATAMRSQLGTVRSQIAAWQVQNGGQIPGGPGGTADEAIDTLIADGYLTRTVFVSPGFVWIWDSSRAELEIEYDPSIDPSIPDADGDGDGDADDVAVIRTW